MIEKDVEAKNRSHGTSAHIAHGKAPTTTIIIIAFDKPTIGRICDNFVRQINTYANVRGAYTYRTERM